MAELDHPKTRAIIADLVRSRLRQQSARDVARRNGCSFQYVYKLLGCLPKRPADEPFDLKKRQYILMKVPEDKIVAICTNFIVGHKTCDQLCETYQLKPWALNEIFYAITDTSHVYLTISETNMLPALENWRQSSNLSIITAAELVVDKTYLLRWVRYGWRPASASIADSAKEVTGLSYSEFYSEYFNIYNGASRFFLKQALQKDNGSDALLRAFAWAYLKTVEMDEK